jgi:peptidoglycan/LPS O-acetylase OafA/YrhL
MDVRGASGGAPAVPAPPDRKIGGVAAAARRRICGAIWPGLSFQLACMQDAINRDLTYFTAPAAVFPFAVGAVLYFLGQGGGRISAPLVIACAFAAWIANMLAGGAMLPASHIFGWGYLIDTICFAVVVSGLSGLSADRFGPLAARIDRTLGEWSYFAFLVHWLAGFLVAGAFFSGDWRGWPLLFAVTPVVLAASAVLAWLNRISVEPLRSWVRRSSRPAAVPSGTLPGLGVVAETNAN